MSFKINKSNIQFLLSLLFMFSTVTLYAQNNFTKTSDIKQTFIMYYFHGHLRCTTCKNMEKWAKHVMRIKFKNELKQGTIKFQAINYETKENEHFLDKYMISNKHIILSKIESGEEKSWKELDKIWIMVQDRPIYETYIENEIKDFIKKPKANLKNK